MLKKTVTFENFNGEEVTKDFYFNFSKAELIEMEVAEEGGFANQIKAVIEAKDTNELIKLMKRIVLDAYGEKSPDGNHFVKTEGIRMAFTQSAAYSDIFMELATDDNAAAEFMIGLMPKGLLTQEMIDAAKDGDTSVLERPQTQDHQRPRQTIRADIAEAKPEVEEPKPMSREQELEAELAALRAKQQA